MPHMQKIEAGADIGGENTFQQSFDPQVVDEVLLECDPKRSGIPVCILSDGDGHTEEVHGRGMSVRPGRYKSRVPGGRVWNNISVSMARGKTSHLIRLKLVGKPPT